MLNKSRRLWAALSGRNRHQRKGIPLSLLVLAILMILFGLITPSRLPQIFTPGNVNLPAATVAPTLPAAPTDTRGGQIVFTCTRKEVNQICAIRADGSDFKQLTTGTSNSYYPAISHDGNHIIFAVNQYDLFDLYRLSLKVIEGARTSESRLKRLTDYIGNAFSPSFSPDDKHVVFVNRVGEEHAALWLMGSNGEDPHPIYTPPGDVVAAAWSPDATTIAFSMAVEHPFAYEVFLLRLDNIDAPPRRVSHEITDIGGSISWSPDQKDVLIFAGPAAAREIFRLDIETGEATQLTFGGNNASPAYSPNGQHIVFNSLRNGGQADLYIINAEGHSMRQLTDNPEPDWQPQWGP